MYLAITLNKLNDFESSCAAFEKAIEMDNQDCSIFFNYAITLYNNGHTDKAKDFLLRGEEIIKTLDDEDKEPEMLEQREILAERLGVRVS